MGTFYGVVSCLSVDISIKRPSHVLCTYDQPIRKAYLSWTATQLLMYFVV